jgi:hypothetical protein
MERPITKITNPEKKLECYQILVSILKAQDALRQMKLLLKVKTDAILTEAGEGYSLNDDFDCVKEGEKY